MQQRAVEISVWRSGIDLDSFVQISQGAVVLSEFAISRPAIDQCLRVFWIDLESRIVFGDGSVSLTEIKVNSSPAIMQARFVLAVLQRHFVIGQSLLKFLLRAVIKRPLAIGQAAFRIAL